MRTEIDRSESRVNIAPEYQNPKLSVIVADGSPEYLQTVRNVSDCHDIVDLVGRSANFEETIQLVVNLRPDLVLLDIEMPSAMVAIAAIILTVADVHIVGMFAGCIPLDSTAVVLAVNAFIDRARLRNELLPLLQAMQRCRAARNSVGRLPTNLRSRYRLARK